MTTKIGQKILFFHMGGRHLEEAKEMYIDDYGKGHGLRSIFKKSEV